MYQYPQVLPIYAQHAADLIFVAILEEQPAEDLAVLLGKLGKHGADPRVVFLFHQGIVQQHVFGSVVMEWGVEPGVRTIDLEQDVGADGIDEGAEGLGAIDTALPDRPQDANEGFLGDVLDRLGRTEAGAELDGEECAKIPGEILLSIGVGEDEPAHVIGIEALALHSNRYYTARKEAMMTTEATRLRAGEWIFPQNVVFFTDTDKTGEKLWHRRAVSGREINAPPPLERAAHRQKKLLAQASGPARDRFAG